MFGTFIRNYYSLYTQLWRVNWQMMYGMWKISQLPEPRVTIFGGSHVTAESAFAEQAHELAHRLVKAHISVITGGGPGIMKAATCPLTDESRCPLIIKKGKAAKIHSLGITVRGLDAGISDLCNRNELIMDHFFTRKWLMINFSIAFAVFPGGLGTLDELAEVATLLQVKKLPGSPLVLISKAYWQPLITWFKKSALYYHLISPEDFALIRITDDLDEAFCWLQERCELCKECKK